MSEDEDRREKKPAARVLAAPMKREYDGKRCTYCGSPGLIDMHPTELSFVNPKSAYFKQEVHDRRMKFAKTPKPAEGSLTPSSINASL